MRGRNKKNKPDWFSGPACPDKVQVYLRIVCISILTSIMPKM